MKIKAIVFKANGNDIKEAYFEADKVIDGLYFSNTDGDYGKYFIEINGIFCEFGNDYLDNIKNMECIENIVESVRMDIIGYLLSSKWINKAQIEFAKQLGYDTTPLHKHQENILEMRETNKIKREDERILKEQEQQKEYAEQMTQYKKSVLTTEIPMSKVIEAMNFFKFKVHPRTLGAMYKCDGVISIKSATKLKNQSWETHSSIIEAVRNFANS